MREYLFRFMTILAIATPLALAGCHSGGGDEHPGDSADSGSQTSGGGAAGGDEHPGGGAE